MEANAEMVRYMQQASAMLKVGFCAYMEQHEHMELWGYPRLAKCFRKFGKGKLKHLHVLNHQLEVFDQGVGRLEEKYEEIDWPRHDIQGTIEVDLKHEMVVWTLCGEAKRRGIELGDPDTANRFTKIARLSREAIEKLQAAISVIDETSIKMYRQNANLD